MRRYTFAVMAIVVALVCWRQPLGADSALYSVENLGTLGGLVPTVTGINASGQVSGYVNRPDGARAVRYTNGHGWEYLTGLDTSSSVANGINAAGDLVGYRFTATGDLRAFRYRDGSGVEDIAPLSGGSMTLGFAINTAGDVVGYADSPAGIVGFLANPGVPAAALPSLGGGFSIACGVNDAGQISGYSLNGSGVQHTMRLDPGQALPVEIGSFDGPAGFSAGCALDEAGRVGGQSSHGSSTQAFRFYGGTLLNLDSLASSLSNTESIAAGTSVGWFTTSAGSVQHAFVHTDADGTEDLNSLLDFSAGWVLSQAKAINASGVIAGEGTYNGAPAVFRLTPQSSSTPDTTPPVFTSLTATPSVIWPPKGQTVTVTTTAVATDDSGETPVCKLGSITGPGTAPADFNVTGANTGTVLAVGGRTYTFNELCVDSSNNVAWSSVNVTVPPDTTAPVISNVGASPSTIWPPNDELVSVTVSVTATDDVDATPACALASITSTATTGDDYAITGPFSARLRATGGRTYTLTVRCSDAAGNSSNAATAVVVPPDTTAPSISAISATPSAIWPPNGKWTPVEVSLTATDNVDANPSCSLQSITGAPSTEYMITGQFSASVRADRNSDGSTRVYGLRVGCSDRAGNTSSAETFVTVTNPTQVGKGNPRK